MSKGTVTLEPRMESGGALVWKIDAPPHVRLRLKRVFGKVAKSSHDQIVLSDTYENCRDIAWFLERYELDISPEHRAHLDANAEEHRKHGRAVQAILTGSYVPQRFELAIPARDYQAVAASLVLETRGLLLADDLGLGKTLVAIAMLTDPRTRPALVVTLTSLPLQWKREFAKFAPQLKVHILEKAHPYDLATGGRPRRGKRATSDGQGALFSDFPDVIISNYHKLYGWAETLAPMLKAVVYDEVQELRHSDSAKYAAAKHISDRVDYRLGMSATPVYNYGGEMFSILECIRPGALGTGSEFANEWGTVGFGENAGMLKDPKAFGAFARSEGLMLRRTRTEVGRELPPLSRITHYVESDPAELDKVAGTCAELCRFLLRGQQEAKGELMHAGGELDYKLRQATGLAKAPYVAKFVELLLESGEKVVLYGWHHGVYDLWKELLKAHAPAFFTGRETTAEKEAARAAFVEGRTNLLIMSLRAGAGLDGLQGCCRTVVFGELDWSPGVHDQGIGRVHRDGQDEPCAAYFLVAESGSDPVVADVLGLKRAQSEPIRNPDGDVELQTVDPNKIAKMAEAFLRQRGIAVPEPEAAQAETKEAT